MVLEKVGVEIGTSLAKEGAKIISRQAFMQNISTKDPIIYFGLWCNFRESKPKFDDARSALSDALSTISESKNTFDKDITWKTFDGYDVSIDQSWENDALVDPTDTNFEDATMECVLGFVLWLYHSSLSNRRDTIVSAYRIFRKINEKLELDGRVPKMKTTSFAFIKANNELCLKIHSRLLKKINGNSETKGLVGTIDLAPLSETMMVMTVPIKEVIVAESLADSFSFWGKWKK
jgi:hypothetical protein